MIMAVNYACYLAYVISENNEMSSAVDKKQQEGMAMGQLLEELKQEAESRGS